MPNASKAVPAGHMVHVDQIGDFLDGLSGCRLVQHQQAGVGIDPVAAVGQNQRSGWNPPVFGQSMP